MKNFFCISISKELDIMKTPTNYIWKFKPRTKAHKLVNNKDLREKYKDNPYELYLWLRRYGMDDINDFIVIPIEKNSKNTKN